MILMSFLLAAGVAAAAGTSVVLENDQAAFHFDRNRGFAVRKIVNKNTGRAIDFRDKPEQGGLWVATALTSDGDGVRQIPELRSGDCVTDWKLERKEKRQELTVRFSMRRENPALSFRATVRFILPDHSATVDAYWEDAVLTGNAELHTLHFPEFRGIGPLGDDYLYLPEYLGRRIRHPGRNLRSTRSLKYPMGASMQFVLFHGSRSLAGPADVPEGWGDGLSRGAMPDETGFFAAALDPSMNFKVLYFLPGYDRESFDIRFSYPFPHETWPPKPENGRPVSLPYPVRFGTFSGNWAEGARLYRDWTLAMPWNRSASVRKNDAGSFPVAAEMRDAVLWCGFYDWPRLFVPDIAAFREYFRVPVNGLWYRYYLASFDMNNPEYFPVAPHFRQALRDLRTLRIPVIPYICSAIWNTDQNDYIRENGASAAVLNSAGSIEYWNINGQKNAWMHPYSPLWQQKIGSIADRLVNHWGMDGIYFDVLGANCFKTFDPAQKMVNGGSHWARGARAILERVRKDALRNGKNPVLTAECFSESLVNRLDGFLSLDNTRGGWRPCQDVFPFALAVYGDRSLHFGGDLGQYLPADYFRWQLAHNLAWGIQPMYFTTNVTPPEHPNPGNDRFARDLVRMWHGAGMDFLNGGERLELALVTEEAWIGRAPAALISREWRPRLMQFPYRPFQWRGPAVAGGLFRAHDGRIAVALVNPCETPEKAELRIEPSRLNITGGILWQVWPLPVRKAAFVGMVPIVLTMTLAPGEARFYELCGRNAVPPKVEPPLPDGGRRLIAWNETVQSPDSTLMSAEDAPCVHAAHAGTLSVRLAGLDASGAVRPRQGRILKREPWMVGRGVRDDFDEKTFFVIRKTPFVFKGDGEAVVLGMDDMLYAEMTVTGPAELAGPEATRFTVCAGDRIRLEKGRIALEPGKYRVAAFPESRWTAASGGTPSARLAGITRSGTGPSSREADRFLANIVTRAVTGAFLASDQEHEWLLPGVPFELAWKGVRAGKTVVTTPGPVTIEPRGPRDVITVTDGGFLEKMVCVRRSATVPFGGEMFHLTAEAVFQTARGFLVENHLKKRIIEAERGRETVDTDFTLNNVYVREQPVELIFEVPKGISIRTETRFTLPVQGQKKLKIVYAVEPSVAPGIYPVTLHIANRAAPQFTQHYSWQLQVTDPKSFVPAGSGPEQKLLQSGNGHFRFFGISGKTVRLELRIVKGGGKAVWEAGPVSGERKFAPGDVIPIELTVPADADPQDLHLKLPYWSCHWFLTVPEGVAFARIASGEGTNVFVVPEPRRLKFFVPPGTRQFSAGGDGGWLSLTSRVRVLAPGGRIALDRDGEWRGTMRTIGVQREEDGKLWTLELTAKEDFRPCFSGNIPPLLMTVPVSPDH